jgi:hypothetical protein
MRGFLGGVSFGALVAAVGAVAWSLSVPLPQSVEVSVAEPARAPVTDPADSSPVEDVGADPDLVETPPAALDPQVVGDDLTDRRWRAPAGRHHRRERWRRARWRWRARNRYRPRCPRDPR